MHKSKLLSCILVLGLMITSCTKDYTCTCTTTISNVGVPSTSSEKSLIINDTHSGAKKTCNKGDNSLTLNGATTTTSCEVK